MRAKSMFLAVGGSLALLTGCLNAPFMPPLGGVYSDINAPLSVDHDKSLVSPKQGEASAFCILCLVSFGDVSTQAAAENGGLKTVHYLDYNYVNLLGLYQKTTVVAHGE